MDAIRGPLRSATRSFPRSPTLSALCPAGPWRAGRRLFDYVDLDWRPAYREIAGQGRTVRTASHWQVRQPTSGKSVGRWKAYEKWLSPMIDAMGGMDWIAAWGYEAA